MRGAARRGALPARAYRQSSKPALTTATFACDIGYSRSPTASRASALVG